MAIQLEVRASAKEFARYKKLVDSDWNKATLDAVIELLWDLIRDSVSEHKEPIELLSFLRKVHGKNRERVPEKLVEDLRLLSFIIREPHMPKMPKQLVVGQSRITAQTEAAIVYLLLQINVQLTGETGFFRDLQSLLYLNSVHYLLPQLQKTELTTSYDSLVNVLIVHAFLVWRDDPSHMFYLVGAMMGQLGHKKERLDCLHKALSATPVDDHSYLTKVSAYWSELLELGEKDQAMEFLLKLARNVPDQYLAEIREMIMETAECNTAA